VTIVCSDFEQDLCSHTQTFDQKMKDYPKRWTNDDFARMSWHDDVVHGIRIRNPDDETYDFELVFDLDYILEWVPAGGGFDFVVAPALLVFHGVNDLKFNFNLSYKQSIQINGVDREEITTEPERKAGLRKWRFRIHLHHDQADAVTFEAMGFTQELTKDPVVPERQWLEDGER
jgi:hypothetical protein